jgi:hypothetical protein
MVRVKTEGYVVSYSFMWGGGGEAAVVTVVVVACFLEYAEIQYYHVW